MIIRFKDRAYLEAQAHIEPVCTREMLEFAGTFAEIPDDEMPTRAGFLHYEGYSWHEDWYVIVYDKPVMETYDFNYTLKSENIIQDAFRGIALDPSAPPIVADIVDNLQYITMKSPYVASPRVFSMGSYELRFEKSVDETPQMYVKFKDSSEYQMAGYFRNPLARLLSDVPVLSPSNQRVNELKAHSVVRMVVQAYISLAKTTQVGNKGLVLKSSKSIVILDRNKFLELPFGGQTRDAIHYITGSSGLFLRAHRLDMDYTDLRQVIREISSLSQVDSATFDGNLLDRVHVGDLELDELKDDVNHFYIGSQQSNWYRLPLSLRDTHFSELPLHTCPVFGFLSATASKYKAVDTEPSALVMSFFSKIYYKKELALAPFYATQSAEDFEILLNKVKAHLPANHDLNTTPMAICVNDSWYTEGQLHDMEQQNKAFEKYNLVKVDYNKFLYAGSKFYADDSDVIGDYDSSPSIEFFGERDDLHLGVELEVDKGGETHYNAAIALGILGNKHAYAMHDGSLNDGFEMATMPMTLDYHMSIEQRYKDAFGFLSSFNYASHNTSTCGLHVHFDRSFFGRGRQTQTLKASYLALIMEKNWEKFVQFSRRDYGRLDQWAKKLDLVSDIYADDNDEDAVNKFNNKYGDGDKYVALNTNHAHSFELRIFRGTLKPETYLATVQFVDNLVRVAKDCTTLAKAQQITFADIINYKPHAHLVDYVTSRGILTRDYIEYRGE